MNATEVMRPLGLTRQEMWVWRYNEVGSWKNCYSGTAIRITYSVGSRNNQHYALICTIPLFYILVPTCFGSSLPSSGSFLDPSELPEIRIEKVIVHPS
jgi:hypothetical protein